MRRKTTFVRVLSLLFALAILFAITFIPTIVRSQNPPTTSATTQPTRRLLLMHYMPWYETPDVSGKWGSHWTGPKGQHKPDTLNADGLPDIWSHYHPLIGLYDSSDPDVLECHLLQMKLAGVDGVIVDWYGLSRTHDYPAIHRATRALFEATARLDMQFAVCFEDRTIEAMVKTGAITDSDVPAHLADTFQWMQTHWLGAPHYARVDGKPLVLCFGPIYVKDKAPWQAAMDQLKPRPEFFALHHLWRDAGADGGFTWIHFPEFNENPDQPDLIRTRLRETYNYPSKNPTQVIPSVYPGFKDVYDTPHERLDHRAGQTLLATLDVALKGPWNVVQIATWNDYGEGTMIEPTHQFGYQFLESIQSARQQ